MKEEYKTYTRSELLYKLSQLPINELEILFMYLYDISAHGITYEILELVDKGVKRLYIMQKFDKLADQGIYNLLERFGHLN